MCFVESFNVQYLYTLTSKRLWPLSHMFQFIVKLLIKSRNLSYLNLNLKSIVCANVVSGSNVQSLWKYVGLLEIWSTTRYVALIDIFVSELPHWLTSWRFYWHQCFCPVLWFSTHSWPTEKLLEGNRVLFLARPCVNNSIG